MKITKEEFTTQILKAFDHIFKILFNMKNMETPLKIIPEFPESDNREVAILIHFVDGLEGKIILSCSRKTAINISNTLLGISENQETKEEEQKVHIKNSLGEIMNILSGKLAYSFQQRFGTTRITTPAMISGNLLFITVYDEKSHQICIESQFGNLEILLSIC